MIRRVLIGLVLASAVVGIAGLAFYVGHSHALADVSIKRVTATEAANAMRDDRFYSEYGNSTLLVDGSISSSTVRNKHLVVKFSTHSSFQAMCDLGSARASAVAGATITVITEGALAERQPNAVVLHDCVVP